MTSSTSKYNQSAEKEQPDYYKRQQYQNALNYLSLLIHPYNNPRKELRHG